MIRETTQICWDFPGGVGGLLAAFFLLAAIVTASYYLTLRNLSPPQRVILVILRMAMLAAIIFCLCNPRIVKKAVLKDEKEKKNIAVILDESSSMRIKNNLGRTRLEDAMTFIRNKLQRHSDIYELKYFAFAETLRPADSLSDIIASAPSEPKTLNTRLYENIARWAVKFSSEKIDAVICLTDGIDTSNEAEQGAAEQLAQCGIPHIFVPIQTPQISSPCLDIKRIEAPSTVTPDSLFTVTTLIGISGITGDGKPRLTIKKDNAVIHDVELPDGAVKNTVVNLDIMLSSPGIHIFDTAAVWKGKTMSSARWSIQCAREDKTKILLYQGSLNWGTTFLRTVFANETQTSLDVKFAPDLFGGIRKASPNIGFPLEGLGKYNSIILMGLKRSQVSSEIEKSIRDFVWKGGGVLFIIPNPDTAAEFANSPLEKILPAFFESEEDGNYSTEQKVAQLLKKMEEYRGVASMKTAGVVEKTPICKYHVSDMAEMELTDEGLASGVFMNKSLNKNIAPKFQDMAFIKQGKAGAGILAAHPKGASPKEAKPLLLAQNFGKGRSALLAADSLWRWRMETNSDNHSFEIFWRNMLSWLSANNQISPRWLLPALICEPSRPFEARFIIPPESGITLDSLEFILESDGKESPLLMKPAGKDEYAATFTPEGGKFYRLKAIKKNGAIAAETGISAGKSMAERELKFLTPDLTALKKLASAASGKIVLPESSFDFSKLFEPDDAQETFVKSEKHLWHRTWLFIAIIACAVSELILRRRWKLL